MNIELRDLRIAVRSLGRQRTFTAVAVVTLALGIGATTAIFSAVYGIVLKPLPYVESDRLVTLGQSSRTDPQEPTEGSSSPVNFLDWQRESTTIKPMALYDASRAVVTSEGDTDVVRIGTVTPDFFAVFKAAPMMGRAFTADENRPTGPRAVIVTYGYWQERLGGRADVLSQSVEINGVPWPIVGVAPRGFDFPNHARLWMPVRNNDEQCGRGCVFLDGIGRLTEGSSAAAAQQELAAIAASLEKQFPNDNFDTTVIVQTLHDRTVGNVRFALEVLLGGVAMVLLIACVNVANLVLVRGRARQQEIAVRAALGSGRRGVIKYLLTENLVLAMAGGTLGVVLSSWGIGVLKAFAPANLPRLEEIEFDIPAAVFGMALVVATTLVFGLGPALRLSHVPLAQALTLRGNVGGGGRRWRRSMLLAAEVGLSLVLLLSAGLLLRSLSALQRTNLGFEPKGLTVFIVSLPPARYPAPQVVQTHARIDEQLAAMPGVTRVARISGLPLGPSENVNSFTRPDRPPPPPGQQPGALSRVVDPEYFETMAIPILAGRDFEPSDRDGAQRVVVISRRMADMFWPGEDPVGKPITISRQEPAVIVGVAANVRSQTLTTEALPEMYVPHAQTGARSMMYIVQSTLGSGQVISNARRIVQSIDSRLPLIAPGAMSDLVDEQLARPRFYLLLLGLFATLAVVLAAVGIYGVVAYAVAQRTREIGVRMALGARKGAVVWLVAWQGLRPAAFGVISGLIVAAATARAIRGLLYEVQPLDPATFAGATMLLLIVATVACVIPAARAARVPPADALRAE
jgi:putative ABC transport system permease protein